jgi:hypothetical protein
MVVSVVGNSVLNRYFQRKKERFGVQEKSFDLDVGVTVYHSSDRLKHCPYVYVLQFPFNHPV